MSTSLNGEPTAVALVQTLRCPEGTTIDDVWLSSDETLIYARASIAEMNVFVLLTWFWPEWVAIAVCFVSARGLFRLMRRLRIPVVVGEEQCVRCGYLL